MCVHMCMPMWDVYICTCLCVRYAQMCMGVLRGQKMKGIPWAGVKGGCEPSAISAGHWIWSQCWALNLDLLEDYCGLFNHPGISVVPHVFYLRLIFLKSKSCIWNRKHVFVFLCLASFSLENNCQLHPFSSKSHNFIFLIIWLILHVVYMTHYCYLFICWETLRLVA